MNVQIIQVPYDSGHKSVRTGRGPNHFIENGISQILRDCGHNVNVCQIESTASMPTEVGTGFELNQLLAQCVRLAVGNNRFPLVLAGNCNSCVGTIAGMESNRLGIVWFDAHGDFNTPETTITGFLDGMGLAMATGRCWQALLKTVPGFIPVPINHVVHVGALDLDIEERKMFEHAGIPLVVPSSDQDIDILKTLKTLLTALKNHVDRIYLHIDMDVLDTDQGQPNHLAVPGGLSVEVVEDAIGMIREYFTLGACGISSYDPDYDKGDCVLNAGVRIIKASISALNRTGMERNY
jgi:arginase